MELHRKNYDFWTTDNHFDEKTKEEIKAITDENEIKERFYKNLEFGTAGLRGILGAGTNRMNIYTVGASTQGFADYLLNEDIDHTKGVAISFDPRNMSKEFAKYTALVFNANGIKTYIYTDIRPTPQLSFTIRHLNCVAGVMITASHNPKEYNGYKVYGPDGAQVNSPYDEKIINYVNNTIFDKVKTISIEEAKEKGLYIELEEDIDIEFLKECQNISLNPELIKEFGNIPIVYTPLHGAGYIPTINLLKNVGFTNIRVVESQAIPDGNFPTIEYPNPEEREAFNYAIEITKEINAEIIFAQDPDADRVGVMCRDKNGDYVKLNGNMVGVILAEYVITQMQKKNKLPKNAAIITSVVSSQMTNIIAEKNNIKCFEVFTGFKHIGELIKKFETEDTYKFIYGFEESYGYLIGDYARDKDAIGIAMIICEICAYLKSKNLTMLEYLNQIYLKYGFYKEDTVSIVMKGITGSEKIQKIMEHFTDNYPKQINGIDVKEYKNYKTSQTKNLQTGEITKLDYPVSNIRYFKLVDDTWACLRPSGTEPKLKLYIGVVRDTDEEATKVLEEVKNDFLKIVSSV
ncbi:MAG: phospho-sugar mutase [Defluviitaleaceae bacterium]|nr:phospho-sugar mutase [Defluviitaleaceae bacterium]